MQRIVINACHGGFGLSPLALERLQQLKKTPHELTSMDFRYSRADADLVQVVEELGRAASDSLAHLKIVEVPYGVGWEIAEYDGMEWVAEHHRTWS